MSCRSACQLWSCPWSGRSISPVNTVNGLQADRGLSATAAAISSDAVREMVAVGGEVEMGDFVLLVLVSSRWTFGPPASEHQTPCRSQFPQGTASLHLTCRFLHCAQPFRLFLWPTRGALFSITGQVSLGSSIITPIDSNLMGQPKPGSSV